MAYNFILKVSHVNDKQSFDYGMYLYYKYMLEAYLQKQKESKADRGDEHGKD